MLTLNELRKMVRDTAKHERMPTARAVMESGEPVIASRMIDGQSGIWVYQDGYVIFRTGKQATVFRLENCGTYRYEALSGLTEVIPADYFEGLDWYVRLILEGEDRVLVNQEVKTGNHKISYSAVAEDWGVLADAEDMLEAIIREETVRMLLDAMTEKQRQVVRRYFFMDEKQEQIASDLGITRQAVTDMLAKAIRRARRAYDRQQTLNKK